MPLYSSELLSADVTPMGKHLIVSSQSEFTANLLLHAKQQSDQFAPAVKVVMSSHDQNEQFMQ